MSALSDRLSHVCGARHQRLIQSSITSAPRTCTPIVSRRPSLIIGRIPVRFKRMSSLRHPS